MQIWQWHNSSFSRPRMRRERSSSSRRFSARSRTSTRPTTSGFATEDQEIGLDPHGASSGPIAYWDTDGIAAKVAELTAAGWRVTSEAKDVGGGMLVAQLSDGNGSTIGLRQSPK